MFQAEAVWQHCGPMRSLMLTSLLCPLVALAGPEKFEKLKTAAQPVGGFGTFMEKYIGECPDPVDGAECRQHAKKFREKASGKKYHLIVSEDAAASVLAPGGIDEENGEMTVKVAPMFASGGYALTHGAPKKTDANGNPMVMFVEAAGDIPDGYNAQRLSRLFQQRALRAEVIFTPQGTWTLPKKGGGKWHGVKAKVDAILITMARTGEPVGVWYGR
jgi:hypothetical protein